ncbi:MAG: CBS domain-containing protein [Paracoccus sp. (in: a-proteobacteria)]|uniref:CBS domain-containing protein n=1 Tax=Paracoccus sp. TaxID=267 RepID=UPI0026E06A61|nr:CBS domain-containing protein [Paracoccus sp. (in: a-proteobacteria)]MDO5613558.1 CBS domain-containing protein [Paracoccus sp. (in: a-proteobacteria)]
MLVNQILALKNGSDKPGVNADAIMTIKPDATVADAARLLAEHRIGAVVVSADGQTPAGILSERDIVRQIGKNGPGVLDQPVSGIMTASVQTCTVAENALTVLQRMTQGRFRHMPVVDDNGHMLGVVSIGDAVSGRLQELAAEREALTGMIMGN